MGNIPDSSPADQHTIKCPAIGRIDGLINHPGAGRADFEPEDIRPCREVAVQFDDFPGAEIYGEKFDDPLSHLVGPKDQVVPIRAELHLNSGSTGRHDAAEFGMGVICRFQ